MAIKHKKHNIYWGDLHNHNSAGTAFGTMERTLDIAQSNLDVYAFTGQSQWHDMKVYENGVHEHWLKGFKEHLKQWPKNKQLIEEANEDGRFVAFMGYECHSSEHGDYNIIFPDDNSEFRVHPTMEDLAEYAREKQALIIPHHIGYPSGRRGVDWDFLNSDLTPVVEIISEHGGTERDEGPFPYHRHGMGSRMTRNTYQYALEIGLRIGAIGGTDNHIGFPGGYGEGLTAFLAENLDRKSIFEALRDRRVYAVSGDRIGLSFAINDHIMGEEFSTMDERKIEVVADACDRITMIEVLKNNKVIHRHFTDDLNQSKGIQTNDNNSGKDLFKFRLEFGWGPWGDLNIAKVCEWDIDVRVENGRLLEHYPCFGSGPFDEEKRSTFLEQSEESCRWISYTRRSGAFEGRPNGVVFEIEGDDSTLLHVTLKLPTEMKIELSLKDLKEQNDSKFVGGFQSEMLAFHRVIPYEEYHTSFSFIDHEDSGRNGDFYYTRVTQDNGQMAWSSPIWVNKVAE